MRLDLPAPPVPVMPTTGARELPRAAALRSVSRSAGGASPDSSIEIVRAICCWSRAPSGPNAKRRPLRAPHARDHVLDHAVEPEATTVLRRVDLLDAVGLEFLELVRRDRAAAADDHADVAGAALAQHVHHVAEILVVAALVGTDGDAVCVFLDRGAHDVGDAAVVTEVHDFRTVRLQQATDDVDRSVVTVEQRGGADETQRRR